MPSELYWDKHTFTAMGGWMGGQAGLLLAGWQGPTEIRSRLLFWMENRPLYRRRCCRYY